MSTSTAMEASRARGNPTKHPHWTRRKEQISGFFREIRFPGRPAEAWPYLDSKLLWQCRESRTTNLRRLPSDLAIMVSLTSLPFRPRLPGGEQDCQATLQPGPPTGKLVGEQVGQAGQGGGSKVTSNLAILVSKGQLVGEQVGQDDQDCQVLPLVKIAKITKMVPSNNSSKFPAECAMSLGFKQHILGIPTRRIIY